MISWGAGPCYVTLLEEEGKEAPKKKGVKSEVWRVKPRADDRQGPGSSAAPVNMVIMLPPIQAVGFSKRS